jgi:23S rRNA (pseudouridine1915-N3)-methyltransferase
MKLALVFTGGHKEEWLNVVIDDYTAKLKPFCPFEIIRLKPSGIARASSEIKRKDESDAILRVLKKDDWVVLCDERGEQLNSRKFSEKMVKAFERGKPRVVFVVGGAFGFSDELKARADWTWSLSMLVFNHHIAQAVVLEQVYRAFAIWRNLPYHND